ncbi:MAG: hypothetical protein HY331_19135 [Chloroflexi bacterium]|nr:hypothetical protein [Chloroflexota bacterium]
MTGAHDRRMLARRLLAAATPPGGTLAALVAGIREASHRLDRAMSPLGPLTFRLIMDRAIRRAGAQYDSVRELDLGERGIDAAGLLGRWADRDEPAVRQAFEELLDAFLELLMALLGRDLTLVLVEEAIGQEDTND